MTQEDNTPKTELDAKIALARQKLQELKDACQDPEVRDAICDLLWNQDDPEAPYYCAEEACDENDGCVMLNCAVSLAPFTISGGGEDDDGNELPYKYENV